jgi:hypothetical protein
MGFNGEITVCWTTISVAWEGKNASTNFVQETCEYVIIILIETFIILEKKL